MNRAMRLAELLPDIDAVSPSLEVTGLVLDSREVECEIWGKKSDGSVCAPGSARVRLPQA